MEKNNKIERLRKRLEDRQSISNEKCIREITLRVGDSMFLLLSELANREDRPLAEYIRYLVQCATVGG